jgi:hypothetical protein
MNSEKTGISSGTLVGVSSTNSIWAQLKPSKPDLITNIVGNGKSRISNKRLSTITFIKFMYA